MPRRGGLPRTLRSLNGATRCVDGCVRVGRRSASRCCGAAAAVRSRGAGAAGDLHLHRRHGQTLTSDRPIPECIDREQRVLNPRRLAAARRAADADGRRARRARRRASARPRPSARRAQRRRAARPQPAAALPERGRAPARRASGARRRAQRACAPPRRRIARAGSRAQAADDEAEFYKGKPLPPKLQAADRRQRRGRRGAADLLVQNQKAEIARINTLYDAELARLQAAVGRRAAGLAGRQRAGAGNAAARQAGVGNR